MRVYVVTVCSSSEYGCGVSSVDAYSTKKEAKQALSEKYKEAKMEFDCEIYKEKEPMSFTVSNYDCSYDCISGDITECEV